MYLDFFPLLVGADGAIRGPAGRGRIAAVAQDDIADAATVVLQDPSAHEMSSYDLTGPESLSLDEVAGVLTAGTGREVRYVDETVPEAYASRSVYGAPDWLVEGEAWVSTYTAIAAGELADLSTAVLDLTGHPPKSLADLLR